MSKGKRRRTELVGGSCFNGFISTTSTPRTYILIKTSEFQSITGMGLRKRLTRLLSSHELRLSGSSVHKLLVSHRLAVIFEH